MALEIKMQTPANIPPEVCMQSLLCAKQQQQQIYKISNCFGGVNIRRLKDAKWKFRFGHSREFYENFILCKVKFYMGR